MSDPFWSSDPVIKPAQGRPRFWEKEANPEPWKGDPIVKPAASADPWEAFPRVKPDPWEAFPRVPPPPPGFVLDAPPPGVKLVPVDHDPFATVPQDSGSGPLVVTVTPHRNGAPKLVPVDHDPFAAQPVDERGNRLPPLPEGFVLDKPAEGPWTKYQKQAEPEGPWTKYQRKSEAPWEGDPIIKPANPKAGVIPDVAKSAGSGLVRGATGVLGLPELAARGINYVSDTIAERGADAINGIARQFGHEGNLVSRPDLSAIQGKGPASALSTESMNAAIDSATGLPVTSYKPQTVAGEYARTVGEFAPGLALPGGPVAKVVGGVLAPAVATETAGQAARRVAPELEAAVRAGTAVVSGVGFGAAASRLGTAQSALAASMRGVDDATITAAGQLMQAAHARGVALTWPEAVAQATNGGATGLTNMQRVVEGSQGGAGVMGPFMAQRPAQIERAARGAFDTVAPQSPAPSTLGPAIGEAAERTAADARAIRTNAVRPAYEAAANDVVPADRVNAVIAQLDEIIASDATGQLSGPAQQMRAQLIERPAIPGSPASRTPVTDVRTGKVIRYETTPAVEATPAVPRTNVGQLDEVYGSARDQFMGAAPVGQTGTEARANRLAGQAVSALDTELQAASPALRQGREQYQALTRQFIDPLLAGPIGKLAKRDIRTQEVINVLFPKNPLPGSAPEIIRAVGNLAERAPGPARMIVRAHMESVFNETARALQSGASQYSGAGFAAALRGNSQQAENLAAAIQGVAGPQVLQGFDEFLNIVSATGQRQRIGSQTAFNQEAQDTLRKGGALGELANTAATAGIKLPAKIKETYERWRLGKNTEQIARLITDPGALEMFRRLARVAPGSSQAQAMAARLTSMATSANTASQSR